MDKTFEQITALSNEIRADAAALAAKQDKLRALMRQWAGSPEPAKAQPKSKGRGKKSAGQAINVAATVRALVNRQTGLTAVQIMDKLGLRDREAAVRSALKKDPALVNAQGRWYPAAPNPQTEKAPAPSGVEPVYSAQSEEDVRSGNYRNA